MDTISELAAAGFFFAAGLLAAVTAPDWIIGAAVGVCLLLVGTVLFQKGMKQLMQEMQTRRTEEKEQMTKQLEKLQTALDELQDSEKKGLVAVCSEVADLHTTAKDASEKAQEAAENIMRALDNQKDDQRRNIEKLCGKLDNTAKDICAKLNSQQTELQACRTEEKEQMTKQFEKLQTALDELQASEKKVWKQYAMKLLTCTLPRKMLVKKHRKRQKISYGRWIIRKTTSAEILKNFAGSWITQKRISALS